MTKDPSTDMPLWQQVLTDLEQRLGDGEFAERFPTDLELVEHYGVSRHTVREAARQLKARGLIQRQRGRGSFVREGGVAQQLGTLFSLFSAVEDAGMEQVSDVLSLEWSTDARAAARFGLAEDTRLVVLERIRRADGEPLALDTVWLRPDVGEPILGVDFAHTSLYDELEEHADVRIVAGSEIISAVSPTDEVRDVLGLDDDEAILRIERLGRSDGEVVECRVTLVRGNRFRLVSEWPPTGPARPSVGADPDA